MENSEYQESCREESKTNRYLSTDTDAENYIIPTRYPPEYTISDSSPEENEEYRIDKEWDDMPEENYTRCSSNTKKWWTRCFLHRSIC